MDDDRYMVDGDVRTMNFDDNDGDYVMIIVNSKTIVKLVNVFREILYACSSLLLYHCFFQGAVTKRKENSRSQNTSTKSVNRSLEICAC